MREQKVKFNLTLYLPSTMTNEEFDKIIDGFSDVLKSVGGDYSGVLKTPKNSLINSSLVLSRDEHD